MKIFDPFHKMLGIVNEVHQGHKDENDNPLILHLLASTVYLSRLYKDQDLLSISLGQYLFEKTDISKQQLLNEGFSYRVISTIEILTKDIPYSGYRERILESKDASRVIFHRLAHLTEQRGDILLYKQRRAFISDIRIQLGDNRLISNIV